MKKKEKISLGIFFYRILCVIAVLLALFIVSLTVYTVIARSLERGKPVYTVPAKPADPLPEPLPADNIFWGIGRIRAITGDEQPQTVIVSIAFPYDKEDVPFTEELAAKIGDFRALTRAFFAGLGTEELRALPEENLKAELLKRYNGVLHLGQISVLYFNDFLIIE